MMETEQIEVMKNLNELWPGEVSDLRLRLYCKVLFNIPGGFVIDALEELAAEEKMRPTPRKVYAIAKRKLDKLTSMRAVSEGDCRWCDGYEFQTVEIWIIHTSLLEPGMDIGEGDMIPSGVPGINMIKISKVDEYPDADRREERVWCPHCCSTSHNFFFSGWDAQSALRSYDGYFKPKNEYAEQIIHRMNFITPPPVQPKLNFSEFLATLPEAERVRLAEIMPKLAVN